MREREIADMAILIIRLIYDFIGSIIPRRRINRIRTMSENLRQ